MAASFELRSFQSLLTKALMKSDEKSKDPKLAISENIRSSGSFSFMLSLKEIGCSLDRDHCMLIR